MRLPDDSETPFQINIVPMIDVIFSILAFFIVSTLYLTRSEGLPVNLPTATTAETQLSAPINVTITADGKIALNRQAIRPEQLASGVRQFMGTDSEVLVIINADENVSHGRVVSVMDSLRQVRGVKLAIATHKP
ncbi:MAG TPA: biopolymer transporter ExbD [Cyanophyceae cyanobacterium]